jgi:glycosyltransferase involved in cell wall biosynthesis
VKVTLLGQFFPPETFAGANRIAAMSAALARTADVRVVTVAPSYPDPSLYSAADTASVQVAERVAVLRTRSFVPHGRGLVARALGEQRMAAGLLKAAARFPTDAVIASSPGMFIGPAALALARARRVPFIWDIRDMTWIYARETASTAPTRLAAAALEYAMWFVGRRADLLVAANAGIGTELVARELGTEVLTIENAVDSDLLPLLDPGPAPASARPIVTYAGLIGRAQALGVLCDVARLVPEADFHLAGDGPERAAIQAEGRRRRLENLIFHGYVRPPELAALYHRSTVLFAQLHRSDLHAATALPSKLHEYMASGRPVVYAGEGLASRTIATVGSGIPVEPDNAPAIAAAVRTFLTNPQAARDAGLAGRRFVENRPSRRETMGALVDAVEDLSRGRGA